MTEFVVDPTPPEGVPITKLRRRLTVLLEPTSPGLTIAGVLLMAAGFSLVAVGWYETSGLSSVGLQMPYLVSAAVTGLALVIIGVAAISIAARRQESDRRIRKLDRLNEILSELQPDQGSPVAERRGAGGA